MKAMLQLAIFLINTILLISCVNTPEKEVHKIPDDFTGWVLIAFDLQTTGEELKLEQDKRLYEIPDNGILLTKAAFNQGVLSHDYRTFFTVDDSGTLTPIKEGNFNSLDQDNREKIISNLGVVGTTEEKKNTGGGLYYFIGTKKDYLQKKKQFQDFIKHATSICMGN